jgi:hypothetical protein
VKSVAAVVVNGTTIAGPLGGVNQMLAVSATAVRTNTLALVAVTPPTTGPCVTVSAVAPAGASRLSATASSTARFFIFILFFRVMASARNRTARYSTW